MSPGAVAVLIPVLRRPHRVVPVLGSAESSAPDKVRVMFIASPGDEEEIDALREVGAEFIEHDGTYAAKINAGIRATGEPLIFTGADDLAFHPGWLEEAVKVMVRDGASVVGTQDLCNPRVIAGRHATHFLVRRDYVAIGTADERGKLLHEGYPHEYVDDELIATARARNLYAFANDSVVEHLHPLAGKAPVDDLYAGASERMKRGKLIFDRRRRLWERGA